MEGQEWYKYSLSAKDRLRPVVQISRNFAAVAPLIKEHVGKFLATSSKSGAMEALQATFCAGSLQQSKGYLQQSRAYIL